MKFLCGRPGCGKESTATLQIDAPSETVALVDPRVSRDGVPLCARHADATTPPVGWTMNDLRSRNRALAAVPDEGTVPAATPPRVRPEGEPAADDPTGDQVDQVDGDGQRLPSGRVMPRRQSIADRAAQAGPGEGADDHKFRSSRPGSAAGEVDDEAPAAGERRSGRGRSERAEEAPDSRPSRRRDVPEEVEEPEDRFPWHHQYQNDEPVEMQASSPLLSRAFRSSTG